MSFSENKNEKEQENIGYKPNKTMDVELQILKHLKRDAQPTVSLIDQYCEAYKDLFPEVRSYEYFKYLHQGIVSQIKRKSLPETTKIVGSASQ